MTEHSTVTRDLRILVQYVERDTRWIDTALRDEMVHKLKHPTAKTLILNVGLIVEDDATPPVPLAAARRLEALIDVLTVPQLETVLAAA